MEQERDECGFDEEKNLALEGVFPFHCQLREMAEKGLAAEAHWHHYAELIYPLEGELVISLNGSLYNVRAGELLVANARETHAIWVKKKASYICVKFDPDLLYVTARSLTEVRYFLPVVHSSVDSMRFFPQEMLAVDGVGGWIREIVREFENREYGFELAVKSGICRICLWIVRAWKADADKIGAPFGGESDILLRAKDLQRLYRVMDMLDQGYMEEVTTEEFANRCGMSYSYFSRTFKIAAGQSFTSYLNEIRLSEAERLLVNSNLSVSEVAEETGFASASYFISQFRKSRNLSPKQFQKKVSKMQSLL